MAMAMGTPCNDLFGGGVHMFSPPRRYTEITIRYQPWSTIPPQKYKSEVAEPLLNGQPEALWVHANKTHSWIQYENSSCVMQDHEGLTQIVAQILRFCGGKNSTPKSTLHQGLTLHPSCGFSTTRPTSAQLLMLLRMVAAELSWGRHDHAARNRGCLPGKYWLQWVIGFSFPFLSRRGWVKIDQQNLHSIFSMHAHMTQKLWLPRSYCRS